MRHDCIFIGLNTVDALALYHSPLKEDEKIHACQLLTDGGGPSATAACAFSQAGGKAALLSVIGQDAWTPFVLKQLRAYRVDTSLLRLQKGLENPVSLILVNGKNGARTIIWNSQGLSARRLKLTAREKERVMRARCLHFDGHLMPDSITLAGEAKKRGLLVSYDCGSAKPGWEKLAANADFFIASHRFARDLGLPPKKAVQYLRRRFGFHAAVTCGEKGVFYFCERENNVKLLKQRAYKAVDTTGCGDVFHGFFLAAALKDRTFEQALAFAQKAAGLKTRRLGGRAGIPELKA
ncbi:MAG: hypothetical protein GX410_08580 [Elusimicrobia bacterium]|nr:hypothetical protein [Elusimicrobiota bacterium]